MNVTITYVKTSDEKVKYNVPLDEEVSIFKLNFVVKLIGIVYGNISTWYLIN